MRVLVTGFEPFGGHPVNPSALVAERFDGAVLPVGAATVARELDRLLESRRPNALLGLGLAPRRETVQVERLAINLLDFEIPDNDGMLLSDREIEAGGPAAVFSTLPVKAIAEAWRRHGIPSQLSNSAGTYICNQLLYVALRRGLPAGFIHLPP